MSHCCGIMDFAKNCENFQCKISETNEGIRIDLNPKDKSKVKALHQLVQAKKELCDCGPDCCGN